MAKYKYTYLRPFILYNQRNFKQGFDFWKYVFYILFLHFNGEYKKLKI